MDTRTKREKIAAMAAQTESPHEAEVAKRKLADLPAPTTLSRDDILAQPSFAPPGTVRFYDEHLRVTVVMDDEDFFGEDLGPAPEHWPGEAFADNDKEARRERLRRAVFGA